MKVMLVSHRFLPDDAGGVEQYTGSLAAELARTGDSVVIVARRSERGRKSIGMVRERMPDGTPVYRILAGDFNPELFLDGHEEIERIFAAAVLETRPEIVHLNHLVGFTPRLVRIAHRLGAAVVVSLHDFYFACPRVHLQKPRGELCHGPDLGRECVKSCFPGFGDRLHWGFRQMYFARALRMAEQTIAYSRYVAAYFEEMRRPAAPIAIIENGVLPKADACARIAPRVAGPLTLAYCGTVVPHKGPHLIVDALRIAAIGQVRLRIIGQSLDESYRARLLRTAASVPGLTLQMYGRFARHDLPLLLGDVDCVVVPSAVPEAGPIAPREALAAGIPVIASRLGALPELIAEGENGFTFDPGNTAELASVLRKLAADPALLARLQAGAVQSRVVTVAKHVAQVRQVYDAAIADFARRGRDGDDLAELELLHEALVERERRCKELSRPKTMTGNATTGCLQTGGC